MDILESYLFLFFDSFFANFIFSFSSEMAIKLMLIFEGYNKNLVFILALFGSLCGSIINFFIGRFFKFLRKTEFFLKKERELKNAEEKWEKYLVWILIFSWFSFIGNAWTLLAGFMNTGFRKFIILVFSGKLFYYFYLFHFI